MKLLEESMEGLPKNSRAYLDRVLAKAKLQQQYRDERVVRGLDAQNLGAITRPHYVFSAIIAEQNGTVDAKRQAFEDTLDAEFPSPAPLLPEPKKSKKRKN